MLREEELLPVSGVGGVLELELVGEAGEVGHVLDVLRHGEAGDPLLKGQLAVLPVVRQHHHLHST